MIQVMDDDLVTRDSNNDLLHNTRIKAGKKDCRHFVTNPTLTVAKAEESGLVLLRTEYQNFKTDSDDGDCGWYMCPCFARWSLLSSVALASGLAS